MCRSPKMLPNAGREGGKDAMNSLFEWCATIIMIYGASWVISMVITGVIMTGILVYSWYDQSDQNTKLSVSGLSQLFLLILIFSLVLGMMPSEYQTCFWEGVPYLMALGAIGCGIMFIQDRREKHIHSLGDQKEIKQ